MPLEKFQRGNTWWVRGRAADDGKYVRQSLDTSDEALAEAAVREIEARARKRRILGSDAPRPEDEITFAECVLLYDAPPRDAGYLVPIVRKEGKTRVRDMTPAYVKALAKRMMPDAAADTWQRQIITPISAVINNAHELGKCAPIRIKRFEMKDIVKQDVARGKQSRVPKVAGSWPWVLAFCEAADPRDAALAYFMFRHGYRIGQSIAMTRSDDMDLSAARVRIHASKGHPAHWVDLDPEEVVMIANLPPPHRRLRAQHDRVFYIASSRYLYERWQETCAKAGIAYLPPHSAGRHGYGTEMIIRQKVDPVSAAVDKWSDPSVLLKTYSHTEDAAATVRDAFRAGLTAARTPAVQRKAGVRPKTMIGKRK